MGKRCRFSIPQQVIRRLRERNEPIRVFGESEDDCMKRLRIIEMEEPEAIVRHDLIAIVE